MVTAWSLRHFILLATKHDTNEPSAKRGKTHFSPASSGHWLGQGQNLPKLVKRETLKSHLLLQSFCFLLPLNGPRILSVLPGSQDQTRHMVVPQGSAVLLPLLMLNILREGSLTAMVTTPGVVSPVLSPLLGPGSPHPTAYKALLPGTVKSTYSEKEPFFHPIFHLLFPILVKSQFSDFPTGAFGKMAVIYLLSHRLGGHLVGRSPWVLNSTVLHNENLSLPKC